MHLRSNFRTKPTGPLILVLNSLVQSGSDNYGLWWWSWQTRSSVIQVVAVLNMMGDGDGGPKVFGYKDGTFDIHGYGISRVVEWLKKMIIMAVMVFDDLFLLLSNNSRPNGGSSGNNVVDGGGEGMVVLAKFLFC